MSEPYRLKKAIEFDVLNWLNDEDCMLADRIAYAINESNTSNNNILDDVEDWITALKSGKKIVNPISPQEELKWYYLSKPGEAVSGERPLIIKVVEIIAKAHPDVADWLKDGDPDD